MTTDLTNAASRAHLAAFYRDTLLGDVIPFWLRHRVAAREGPFFTVCATKEVCASRLVWPGAGRPRSLSIPAC